MSFPTRNMHTTDSTQHAMNVSLTHEHLPQMLRQSNYLASGDMRTANVNFRVKPHIESGAAPMCAQREQQELYPTQSSSRQQPVLYPTQSSLQQPFEHEHDWSKHEIVTRVAGLHTKLAALDSEIRTGASADAGSAVLRQVQDHANLLRDNAKQISATQAKHKETNALTHKICSKMHDNAQQQSAALEQCSDSIAKLKAKQSTSVGLMHDICSELHNGLLEHGEDKQSLQRDVSLLQQKDVVAQKLLAKMLTMLDQHESVVSLDNNMTLEHNALLDGLCKALEKTKSKMQTFEQAQQEMQRVVADFKAHKLVSAANDTEAIEAKLDRYMRVNKDIDGRCTEALQQHGAKIDELQRAHQQAMHNQQMKMQQLERAHQQAIDEQQSKLQMLERKVFASQSDQRKVADLESKFQELALQQLNSSQGTAISRVLERDVKHMQHQMNTLHGLKKDVEAMQEATNSSVSSVRADLVKLQSDNQARNEHTVKLHQDVQDVKSSVTKFAADKTMSEMQSSMLDLRRDMTLEKIRADKTASSLHDIQCKLAA